jgi:hypothetical protein
MKNYINNLVDLVLILILMSTITIIWIVVTKSTAPKIDEYKTKHITPCPDNIDKLIQKAKQNGAVY